MSLSSPGDQIYGYNDSKSYLCASREGKIGTGVKRMRKKRANLILDVNLLGL